MPRFFCAGAPANNSWTLRGEDAHHAARVLRLRVGEQLTVCDGAGTDYRCEISSVDETEVCCRVLEAQPSRGEPKQRISLFMALPKGDKMDFIVQKATELGALTIVPYLSEHCVSRPDKTEKKVLRWQKIADEAAKQCGRGVLPAVCPVMLMEQALCLAAQAETALFLYENEQQTGLRDVLSRGVGQTVSLMVGPEGGFAPHEAAAATRAGLASVSLGTRILRCETAPLAALAAILYAGGNM